jgi:hypothetical protein
MALLEVRQEDVMHRPINLGWFQLQFQSEPILEWLNELACPISTTPLQERFYSNLFVIPSLEWREFLHSDIVQEMPVDVSNRLILYKDFKKNISVDGDIFATFRTKGRSQIESIEVGQIRLNVHYNGQEDAIFVTLRGSGLFQTLPVSCIYTKHFRGQFAERYQEIQKSLLTRNHERSLLSLDSSFSMNILPPEEPSLSPILQLATFFLFSLCALSHLRRFLFILRH